MGRYTQWTVCDRGLSPQPTDQVGSRRPAGRLSSGGQFCGDRLLGTAPTGIGRLPDGIYESKPRRDRSALAERPIVYLTGRAEPTALPPVAYLP
jgi:hypothetical protein